MTVASDAIGRRRTGWDAAQAIAAHLRLWLPLKPDMGEAAGAGTYLPAAVAGRGLDASITRPMLPTTLRAARAFEPRAEDRPPYVRVVPMDVTKADRDSDSLDIDVEVHVYSVVGGETAQETSDRLTCYEDAVCAVLEQQTVQDVERVEYLAGGDGEVPDGGNRERTLQARADVFLVRLNGALSLTAGTTSPTDPSPKGFEADDVTVDVTTIPASADDDGTFL